MIAAVDNGTGLLPVVFAVKLCPACQQTACLALFKTHEVLGRVTDSVTISRRQIVQCQMLGEGQASCKCVGVTWAHSLQTHFFCTQGLLQVPPEFLTS